MEQHVEFKIAYDGSALRDHLMSVRDLAPALLSAANLFDEANRVLNQNKTSVSLQIKAQEAGSYEVVLHLYQSITSIFGGQGVSAVVNLLALIGAGSSGLFWLIKKLKGKQPDKITPLTAEMVRIEYEGETLDVSMSLLRLYEDIPVRTAAQAVLQPLLQEGIDTFQIKAKKEIEITIEKEDVQFFEVPQIPEEQINTTEFEQVYSLVSVVFKDNNKWRLSSGDTTINAIMADPEFLDRVNRSQVSFTKGDILRCKIRLTQWTTKDGLKNEYQIIQVKEHLPATATRQLSLFSDKIALVDAVKLPDIDEEEEEK